jgi:alpha-glucosidase
MSAAGPGRARFLGSLIVLTSLFFMWGLITSLNDILVPHLKAAFVLDYKRAALIQFCFFFAYFVVSLPAGYLVERRGYKEGIIIGLAAAAIGCVLFYPAAGSRSYPLFLLALFVLASGITLLQVAANPYVTILGSPESASSRLTLTQAFNSLGTTIGPFLGALLILGGISRAGARAADPRAVQVPYLVLASILVLIALTVGLSRLPPREALETAPSGATPAAAPSAASRPRARSVWTHRHLLLGAVGIFCYVGAEVGIGSFLVSLLGQKQIAALPAAVAGRYLSLYWGGAMIGRFLGSALMLRVKPPKVLAANAAIVALLVAVALSRAGHTAMWALLAVGLFNSIMFPTIFSLALDGLGERTGEGSGILCMAIVGGAVMPELQGWLADSIGILYSFALPLACYLYIVFYGLHGYRHARGALLVLLPACAAGAVLAAPSANAAGAASLAPQDSVPWWKHAVFYEVYVRSFYDSDGDGIGDLNGITAKLDYLEQLGIDAIWVTPFYPSPNVDFGYDVSDYENVDPLYGTLADFDRLLSEAHRRHIRVVTDLVINHTSDQHPWFRESRASKDNPKRNWYIWRDGVRGGPPNNWASAFGPTAWTYDSTTAQYYYHFFYPQQPDLNWRNPDVERAMFDVMRFWLRRGVDGFRVDAIDALFEDATLRPNPYEMHLRPGSTTEHKQHFKYNEYQPESFEEFRRLRSVVEEFGPDRLLIGETYPLGISQLRRYYGEHDDAFQLPFNFYLLRQPKLEADDFRDVVRRTEQVTAGRPTAYVLSNHDISRAYDRLGDGRNDERIAKLSALMLLTLRGVPFFYYGEEIGMKTTDPQRLADALDPIARLYWPAMKGRDGERTPMQWTAGPNAGFTTAEKPWLPVPPSAATHNVASMSSDPGSILSFFRRAIRLRRASPALLDGDYESLGRDRQIFAYARRTSAQAMVVALNMSDRPSTLRLDPREWGGGERLRLRISNVQAEGGAHGPASSLPVFDAKSVPLAPYEAAVFEVVK